MAQKSVNFNDVAIVTIGENDCGIHFWFMAKSKALDIIKNADLSEKNGKLWLWKRLFMSNNTPETMIKQQR